MPNHRNREPAAPRVRFVIHENKQGYWVASEKEGFITGIFALERDALRFALARTGRRRRAPHALPKSLEAS